MRACPRRRSSGTVQRLQSLALLTLVCPSAPCLSGDVPELVFPGAISRVQDAVKVAAVLRRPIQVLRGVHRWAGPIELTQRERLILAGADPPRQYVAEEAHVAAGAGPAAGAAPAVLCGRWQMRDSSSGAFCDGVRLVGRMHADAADAGSGQARERSSLSTVLVEAGPWYFDHVCAWAHGGIALHVFRAGTVLGRVSSFGGEASARGLQATSAVLCQGGTASLSLQHCHLSNTSCLAASQGPDMTAAAEGGQEAKGAGAVEQEDAEEEGGIHGVREEEEEGELGDDEASGTVFDTVDTLSPELLQLRAARVSSATAATKSYHAALQVYYYILQDDTPHPTP